MLIACLLQGTLQLFTRSEAGAEWTLHTSVCCGEAASALVVHGDFIAVGTAAGNLFVWKGALQRRLEPSNGFASGPRPLDTWPLTVLCMGNGTAGDTLLAVVLPGKRAIACVDVEKGAVLFHGLQVQMAPGAELPHLNVRCATASLLSQTVLLWDLGS